MIVKGRVQGVWFRDSTRREAEAAGLTGYAINLQNGDVKVMATGNRDALDRLERWLHKGPPLAKVESVAANSVDYRAFSRFEIG